MINKSWFDVLTRKGMQEHLSWLTELPLSVERIADIGYFHGGEPFALLWTLDANEVTVIEKNPESIQNLHWETEQIRRQQPDSLDGRVVTPVCYDIAEDIPELPDNHFDLVFCEDVLYNLQHEPGMMEYAIAQIVRITKPDGLIIAVEPKYGVEFEPSEIDFGDKKIPWAVPLNEPGDMSQLFEAKGLERLELTQHPRFSYCYRRTG